jgi:hypothetical protein
MPKLNILRDGQELGALTDADARELLKAGFLKSTDEFWVEQPEQRQVEQPEQRQTLALLPEQSPEVHASWLDRAKASADTASRTVQAQAASVAGKVTTFVRRQQTILTASTTIALEGYLPELRRMVGERLDKMVGATQAALRDEVFLRKLFGAVYDCLPRPVCRFVSEPAFVEFCFKHRDRLLN